MRRRRGQAEQQREVAGWRASGQPAREYAARRGYAKESLERWARDAGASQELTAPRFVRLEVVAEAQPRGLVVEVGAARIVVEPGFDAAHLRAIVAALGAVTC
jgi:hypothetical protein